MEEQRHAKEREWPGKSLATGGFVGACRLPDGDCEKVRIDEVRLLAHPCFPRRQRRHAVLSPIALDKMLSKLGCQPTRIWSLRIWNEPRVTKAAVHRGRMGKSASSSNHL